MPCQWHKMRQTAASFFMFCGMQITFEKRGIFFMTSAQIGISVTIIVYLLAMLGVGIACSKKNNDTDDFYLGGRKLGPLVTAMSAEASDMSSWLLMGLPGLAYLTGIADAGWTAIGLAIGTYVNWLIVAKRISPVFSYRKQFHHHSRLFSQPFSG